MAIVETYVLLPSGRFAQFGGQFAERDLYRFQTPVRIRLTKHYGRPDFDDVAKGSGRGHENA